MSANNTISIRLEVTGDSATLSKITNVLNGFKGLKGGIEQARSSMQTQWSTGGLTGLGAAIGQTQAQASTLKTRLTEIGGALASNASAFGVATASVWGVYNAYDSLVKVEIRAETAMNRVSTMTTTLRTLEERLTEARNTGNLSAEEMAILEQRITDTKMKLATAQERSADLQGDVNEAWGAFASQVGPQVVAAGGSIVQLYTNMRGSLTGIVPRIKDFISNLSLGGGAAKTMAAGINPLSSVLGELPTKTNAAAKGISALSGAMKGLLIGGGIAAGIFAIGTAIAYFRDQELKAFVSSKDLTDAVAQSDEAFAKFEETSSRAQKTLDLVVKGFGSGFQELIDKARTLNLENTFNAAVGSIAQSKQAIVDLNPVINGLKEKYMEVTKNASFFDIITGKLGESQKILTDEITRLTDMQNKQGESIKTNTALTERLKAAIALKSGVENKDTEFVLQAIAAGLGKAEAFELLNVITEGGTKSLNDHTVATRTNTEVQRDAAASVQDWMTATAEKAIAQKQEEQILRRVIIALNLSSDAASLNVDQMHELIEVYLGLKPATDAAIQAAQEHARALNEAQVKADELDIEFRDMQNQLDLVNRTFGTSFDAVHVYGDQLSFLTDLQHEQNFAFIEEEQSLAKLAQKYGVLTTEMVNMTQNQVDNVEQMKQQIAANVDWAEGLRVAEERLKLVHTGQLTATTSMAEYVNGLVSGQAEAELTRTLMLELAESLGFDMSRAANMTTEELRKMIDEAFIPAEEKAILAARAFNDLQTAALDLFSSLTSAGDMKEFNKAWKELDLGAIPKGVRDDVKDFFRDIRENVEHSNEMALAINTVILSVSELGKQLSDKTIHKIMSEVSDDFDKLRGITPEVSDAMHKLLDPMTKLKGSELDKYIEDTAAAMAKYNELTSDGIFDTTDLAEVISLLPPELQKVVDPTGELQKETKKLSEEQQKITDNTKLAEILIIQAQAFQSQLEFVDLLNESLLLRNILMSFNTGGGNGKNGFTNVSTITEEDIQDPNKDRERLEEINKIREARGLGPLSSTDDTQQMIQDQTDLQVALQKTQTALANLATQGANSLNILAKASSSTMSGIKNNLKVGEVAAQHIQTGLANLSNQGTRSLAALASASSKAMQGTRNNLNVGYVAAGHLQTGLANLANQGARSLAKLASASSSQMNGFVNNLKKGQTAVENLQSAISNLKSKTVHIGLTGPGVKFLAHGFHGVVDKPTLMVVGEAGAEKVDVSPITGGKATGLQFENTRNVKVEPVGKLDTSPRFERETIREKRGPSTIQIVTYQYLYPGSNEFRKSIQQVSLDNTGSFPTA